MTGNGKRQQILTLWHVDGTKLQWHMARAGLNQSQFCEKSGLARNTIKKMISGRGVYPSTVKIAAEFFAVDVMTLIANSNDTAELGTYQIPEHPEWNIVKGSMEPLVRTNSNLFSRSCKLSHKLLRNEFGRGKLYDLLGVADPVREQMVDQLTRHAKVCRCLKDCPQIVENLNVTAVDNGNAWWIVDRWVEAKRLTNFFEAGIDFDFDQIRKVTKQIMLGLSAMHESQIVFRELAPCRVLFSEKSEEVFLTDLELAKLLKYGGTVSADWATDAYRAPEIESGEARPQADFYSWGRLFVHMACGTLPDCPKDSELLAAQRLPKKLRDVVANCLSPDWKKRPASAKAILNVLT